MTWLAGVDSILSALCDLVWLGVSWHSNCMSSPTTLLVSRNVAIDCVQLQVRVHSAQQRSRALLASLLLPKNDSISFAHSISVLLSPFSRRRQNCHTVWTNQIAACTCSNTSTFPAGAKTVTLFGPIRLQYWCLLVLLQVQAAI